MGEHYQCCVPLAWERFAMILAARHCRKLRFERAARSYAFRCQQALPSRDMYLIPALVHEAKRKGVEFLPETKATVTSDTDSRSRHVQLHRHDGVPTVVRSKVVLACDGLSHSSLRKLRLFQSRVAPHARIGVGGVVEDSLLAIRTGESS